MVSYTMVYVGQVALWLCLVATVAAALCLVAGHARAAKVPAPVGTKADKAKAAIAASTAEGFTNLGYLLVFVAALALVVCGVVIVEGFFTHNVAVQYVAQNYPEDTGSLFWLFQLSGLWASRAGSLLTWAILMGLFAAWVAWHHRAETDRLTNMALVVVMVVLAIFVAVMLFSSGNNPFVATDPSYIDASGNLTGAASLWGMNVLLEHWAMALHPPTLFVGYAGMTVPFAYGIAALIVNDPSRRWVDACGRIALFSFIFLTVGIGLGAVWAYVVLGWGGYWGWDPVENASLLSWLTGVAMIHSFTVYRKRGIMKGWSLLTATLTFVCVVLGTFITRSGLVQSVHAFDSDPVSTYLFLAIMIAALAVLLVLWLARRGSFTEDDDIESMASKNGSYYLTNIIMVFSAVLLAYLTVASALPTWLPAGGTSAGSGTYETIARPLGVLFCAMAAVCPFLAWKKTDGREFWKNVRVPAVVAAVLLVALAGHWACNLLPVYEANLAQSDTTAVADLQAMGPGWYYNGLAFLALVVACLLVANSGYLIVRGTRSRMKNKSENAALALGRLFVKSPAQAGGYLTHLGLGIVLAGLVGSSMYVTDRTFSFTEEGQSVQVGAYTITYERQNIYEEGVDGMTYDSSRGTWYDEDKNICTNVVLSVSRDGQELGEVTSSLEFTAKSYYGQTRVNAVTLSNPFEDLFVVYQGHNTDGSVAVNARVNPLISLAWAGFAVMAAGIVCATWPRRATPALKVLDGGRAKAGR